MDIWRSRKWRINTDICNKERRKNLRFRFHKGVDKEVRRACIEFGKWLRSEFEFPVRVIIYFKSEPYIKALDGDFVSATFFEPYSKNDEPHIKIATGDYQEILEECGKDNALASMLGSVAHELTHYFQWINDIKLTEVGYERQANYYSDKIISEYAETREHP